MSPSEIGVMSTALFLFKIVSGNQLVSVIMTATISADVIYEHRSHQSTWTRHHLRKLPSVLLSSWSYAHLRHRSTKRIHNNWSVGWWSNGALRWRVVLGFRPRYVDVQDLRKSPMGLPRIWNGFTWMYRRTLREYVKVRPLLLTDPALKYLSPQI